MDVLIRPAGVGRIAWLRGMYEIWRWKKSMDDVDIARRNQEVDIRRALRNRSVSRPNGDISPLTCEDCDKEIPEGRRKAVPGCTRCVACQALFERGGNG